MDLSIIIVSFNTRKLILECLDSIVEMTKELEYEIVVVDNASKDGSVEALRRLKSSRIQIIENAENLGFAAGNNQGLKMARGKYLLLLNSDTVLKTNLFKEMVGWMEKNPKVGIVGPALKNADGSYQGTGGYFPTLLRVFSWMTIQDLPLVDKIILPFHPMREKSFAKNESFYKAPRELDWVTGACFLIRRRVIDEIGYLDEDYFMYVEELDFCFRAKQTDWQVWYQPNWSILHYGGASGTSRLAVLSEYKGLKLFYQKHYPAWQCFILRILLKIGALGRIVLFSLIEGKEAAQIYVAAYKEA